MFNARNIFFLLTFWCFATSGNAQGENLEMKLQLMNDTCWGVYVTPVGATVSYPGIVGAAQVTIVMPDGYTWNNVTNHSGTWINTSSVFAPPELPDRQIISWEFQQNTTLPVILETGTETLLFTFCSSEPCPDSLYLIDCITALSEGPEFDVCPFCPEYDDGNYPSNTSGSNPGNELNYLDFSNFINYNYQGNYAPSAWSCNDCDGDGIANGIEDTNGDGVWTPGEDESDICDPCDPYRIMSATLEMVSDADVICAGDIGDTAYLVVNIDNHTGADTTKYDGLGWAPFTIVLSTDGGLSTDTIFNYASGDSIAVVPTGTEVYELVSVLDSFLCSAPDSLFGAPVITVHGPILFTDQPDDETECSEDGTSFSVETANAGDGTITYNWQISPDNGVTYASLDNVMPYTTVFTNTLNISEAAGLNGMWYRCAIATEVCDTVYSDWATLTVDGPISVIFSPADLTVCDGGMATFTGGGTDPGVPGNMFYQWQLSTDNGSSWVDLTGGIYSNESTTTLTASPVDVTMDGYQYRMAIYTPTCDRIYTEAATLNVEGPLSFSEHPQDYMACLGGQVYFTFKYDNPGFGNVTYQWQQSLDGGATWVNLTESPPYNNTNGVNDGSDAGDTLAIVETVGLDSALYRVELTSSACSAVVSNAAILSVNGTTEFTSISADDLVVCAGADTIIIACADGYGDQFYYSWEYSNDGGSTWDSLEMTGLFSSSSNGQMMPSGCDTLFISDVSGMYDYKFRAVAQPVNCSGIFSEEVQLRVEGPLSVMEHPQDVVECAGNGVTFSAQIDNPGFTLTTYQWQISVDNGATWYDLSNNGQYSGVMTSVLNIADVTGLNGFQYHLTAKSGTCTEIITEAATLTAEGPILYSQADDPQDVTLCFDDSFSFTSNATLAQAGTLEYQWQMSNDDGVNWSDIDATTDGGIYTGWNTPTLHGNSANDLYARSYRLSFSTGECSKKYSNMAVLNVQGELEIIDQPDDVLTCGLATFALDVKENSPDYINEDHIFYQWQESLDGGITWGNLTDGLIGNGGDGVNGVSTDTLSVIQTPGRSGNPFRALIWTDVCDTLYSDAVTFYLEGPITFIDDPDNISECAGFGVTFSAATQNPGLGTTSYQWEMSTNEGLTWSNMANGGANGFSGVTENILVIDDVAGLYDERFRLKAWTGECDTIWSNYAVLSVEGPISFTNHPDDATICSGEPVCFSVETLNSSTSAVSPPITYQWQIQVPGTGTWVNLGLNSTYNGSTTATMCVSDVTGLDSCQFRVLIQTNNCSTIASDPALLVVEGPISFTRHPENVTQCSGEEIYFVSKAAIAVGNSGTISYQWQQSSDGTNFSDISDGGVSGFAGATTDSLIIGNVVGLHQTFYRLSVNTGVCPEVYSFDAMLSVEGPLAITTDPADVFVPTFSEGFFWVNVTNGAFIGQDGIYFQWEMSEDGGATWTEIYNGDNGMNVINGVESDSLLIAPIFGLDGNKVRMKAWTATCDTLISECATINVLGNFGIAEQPEDLTLCTGGEGVFDIEIINPDALDLEYQWEVSENGLDWNEVTDGPTGLGGMYSGTTTESLSISDVSGMHAFYFRCKIKDPAYDWVNSNTAQVFIDDQLAIDLQPVDIIACENNEALFFVNVTNGAIIEQNGINFQWEMSEDGGTSWSEMNNGFNGANGISGALTDTLLISNLTGLNGNLVRVRTWNTCDTLTTDPAEIIVEGPLSINNQPDDVTLCTGEGTFFEVGVDNPGVGTLQYQWEVSNSGAVGTWSDVTNTGAFSGATTSILSISDAIGLYNYRYRCKIKTITCDWIFSDYAQVFLEGPILFNLQPPSDITICDNSPVTIETNVSLPGASAGALNFQWQENDGNGWINIANNEATGGGVSFYDGVLGTETGEYFGVTTDDLDISLTIGLDGYQYRCLVWTSSCVDTSNVVTIHTLDACENGVCDFDLDGQTNDEDGSSPCESDDFVKMKLQYNSYDESWGVFITPNQSFEPTELSELLTGRITVVGSNDFVPGNIVSYAGGDWMPGATLIDAPENPGMNYFTFNMNPDGVLFDLQYGSEIKLFRFKNTLGFCPDSLYLLEDFQPDMVEENELVGISTEDTETEEFSLLDIHGHNAWVCELIPTGGWTGLDSLGTGGSSSSAILENNDHHWLSLSPNPASDYLKVKISTENTDHQSLVRLMSLHGQTLQTHLATGQNELRLNLNGLPAGLYFLSLEVAGETVARHKLLKE